MGNNVIIQTTSSDFPSFLEDGCYYVDKTLLVKDIVNGARQVSLFTRPRRFGKSLNQSMLQAFFDVQTAEKNAHLFDNLAISSDKELCEKHQGKYPVIKLSFASVVMDTAEKNFEQLFWKLKEGLDPFYSILNDSNNNKYLNQDVLKSFVNSTTPSMNNLSIIRQLTEFLHHYYGSKCVVLLDEYDVPLQTAFRLKYYDQMLPVIRALMTSTFKDNPHLQYGVITGCLKIAKESIFTGFNKPYVNTILTNDTNGERFGFTQDEVDDMLRTCDLWNCRDIVKEWYDGYRFGRNEVYNPFSVANFMD
ncbi:MAG: AAA family ATPase, partial [Victivallales bacterium]|nr:AAA family ATPase [Victivallales bacterium]